MSKTDCRNRKSYLAISIEESTAMEEAELALPVLLRHHDAGVFVYPEFSLRILVCLMKRNFHGGTKI